MNNKEYYFISIVIAVVLLSIGGCATTPEECDPRAGGFIKGVSCKLSGGYDERVKQREGTLAELEQEKKALETAKGSLETEYTAKSQLVVEEREEVRQLGIQIETFRERLDSVTMKSKPERKNKQALLEQLTILQTRADNLKAALSESSIDTLEYEQAKQENERLQKELNDLMAKAANIQ